MLRWGINKFSILSKSMKIELFPFVNLSIVSYLFILYYYFHIQYVLYVFFLGEEVGPAWNSENKRVSGNRVLAGSRADNNWYLQD